MTLGLFSAEIHTSAALQSLLKAQEVAHIGSWVIDLHTHQMECTPEVFRIFGIPPSLPPSLALFINRVHPDDRAQVESAWNQAVQEGKYYDVEHRVMVGDEVRWLHCRADLVVDAQGNPLSGVGTVQDITERRCTEQTLHEQQDRYHAIVSQASDGIVLVDAETSVFVDFNDAACSALGYTREEFSVLSVPDIEAFENLQEVARHKQRMIQRGGDVFETRHRSKSGEVRDVRVSARAISLHGREYISAIFSDITELRQSEAKLRLLATVFAHGGEAIAITDSDNNIVEVNDSFTRLTGYTVDEVRGRNPRVLASGQTPRETYLQMWESLGKYDYWQGEVWDQHKSGHVYPKLLTITVVRDHHNHVVNYVASFTDITRRVEAEQQAYYLAYHDSLTGLPNRANLRGRLDQTLASARRDSRQVAVLFLDLDRFKSINDSLGHAAGDALLMEVAHRLRCAVRESDTVARLGGDEFVVILAESDTTGAALVAGKVLESLSQPFQVAGREFHTTSSIGISMFPEDGGDPDELMQHADSAMYFAKSQGRANYQFFAASMSRNSIERMELEHELRVALQQHQFSLHYQPQINAETGRVVGMEALIRWNHPVRGMISPGTFIPVAEETGLIVALGNWVLNEACRELKQWQERGISGVRMAVNLSARQLRQVNLNDLVATALTGHGLSGSDLELELTESVVMHDPENAIQVFKTLRGMGVHLAIDDFGTGYSSLSYLKLLPINRLKLDQSFVKDIEHDPNDAAISAATIALAHSLGLEVVAEGVETPAQHNFLIDKSCDSLQGFLFSRPLPAAEAISFLLASGVEKS